MSACMCGCMCIYVYVRESVCVCVCMCARAHLYLRLAIRERNVRLHFRYQNQISLFLPESNEFPWIYSAKTILPVVVNKQVSLLQLHFNIDKTASEPEARRFN